MPTRRQSWHELSTVRLSWKQLQTTNNYLTRMRPKRQGCRNKNSHDMTMFIRQPMDKAVTKRTTTTVVTRTLDDEAVGTNIQRQGCCDKDIHNETPVTRTANDAIVVRRQACNRTVLSHDKSSQLSIATCHDSWLLQWDSCRRLQSCHQHMFCVGKIYRERAKLS